jgi:hypothetical protein
MVSASPAAASLVAHQEQVSHAHVFDDTHRACCFERACMKLVWAGDVCWRSERK